MKIAVKFLLVLSIILVSFFLWLNMGTSSPILWNTGKESVQEQEKKDKEKAKDKEQTVHITRQDGTSLKLPLETYLELLRAERINEMTQQDEVPLTTAEEGEMK